MANVIKHKRGSGSDPVASDLVVGEVAIRTDVGKLFTKMDNGTVAEIAGGGSDIAINTLSSSSGTGGGSATFNGSAYRFTLSAPPSVSAQQLLVSINGVIQKPVAGTGQPSEGFSVDGTDIILGDAPATGSDFFILTFKSLGVSEPADNSVTSAKIADGAIVNADINASAAIDVSKLSGVLPLAGGTLTGTLTISNAAPNLLFTDSDHNPDFGILASSGQFRIQDTTNTANLMTLDSSKIQAVVNFDALAGLDVTGAITGTGDLTIDTNTLHVDSSNNRVGIGTTSPSNNLEVASADHTGILIQSNRTTSTSNIGALDFRSSSTDVARIQSLVDGTIKFRNTSSLTERMRIDSSGNVGIGTTSPAVSLEVEKAISATYSVDNTVVVANNLLRLENTGSNSFAGMMFRTAGGGDGHFGTFQNTSSANDCTFYFSNQTDSGGGQLLATLDSQTGDFIVNKGKVGIGTTSPAQLLEIHGASNPAVLLKDTTNNVLSYLYSQDLVGAAGTASNHPFVLNVNNGEKMRIDTSGNIAIGNTDPQQLLHVWPDAANTSSAYVRVTAGDRSSGTGVQLGHNSSGNAELNMVSNGHLTLFTNNSERLTILNTGNVGIGTTSPTDKLDVNGTAIIRSNLYLNNNVYLASNKGIYFDGNTGAANHLDDYEEGTFTPVMEFGGGNTGMSVSSMEGIYTKIGRTVFATLRFKMTGKGSDTGQLTFTALPFAVGDVMSTTAVQGGFDLQYLQGNVNAHEIKAYPWEGTSLMKVFKRSNQNSTTSTFDDDDISGTFDGRISFFYTTA